MADLSVNAAVAAVGAVKNAQTTSEAQMLMLRKAMDIASSSISSMIESLPQPPLATSGTLGTRLNAYA